MERGINITHRHSRLAFARLSEEQCQRLHNASLQILERTGVRLYLQEALDLLKRAGAEVFDGNRVRIPAQLVERALETAPKRLVVYDRNGRPTLFLEGYRSYYGPGSDLLNIIDHRTGERRRPVLQDVREGITLCDALPNIDFVMSMFLPSDVPQTVADRFQMEVMLSYTTKPIVYVTYDTSGCLDAVEMAEIVAGGAQALRERPFTLCYINVTTGLRHNREALEKLLFMADKGLPALYIPVGSGGLTAPITMAGAMALVNAGTLVGLVIAQLRRPGTPIIIPGWGGETLDMRTMVEPYAGADYQGIAESLAHFYGLPVFTLGGASDAKLPDGQAAAEAALTLLLRALSGGQLVHDLGYLESGLCGSLAQLVICDEIVGWIKAALSEVEINDETLALDLIDQVGPDGQFLESEHTLRYYRERWYPHLFERENYERWQSRRSKSVVQRAAERVEEILARHAPPMLPADVAIQVHAVVDRAVQRYG
ncbi:MAG: trimethylamine methyltransferase [Ardenticatenia bacterium]|jgi:trimethylamine--corrinoid protein Co-methyltransferase|nr:MAG: trimethylamine methyltransferase [Ardenticatenia bacterium]